MPDQTQLPAAVATARLRGSQLREKGLLSEARREFHRALALAEHVPTVGPLELVPLLNDIGVIGKYRGDFDEAASAYRRALRIVNECGSDQLDLRASLLHNIAGLAHARGEVAAAESAAREGIALRLTSAATDPLDLAADRAALAAILVDLGEKAEARELLIDVLAVFEDSFGPEHYEVAVTLHNLGSLEHRSGNFEAAAANWIARRRSSDWHSTTTILISPSLSTIWPAHSPNSACSAKQPNPSAKRSRSWQTPSQATTQP
nr:tetratricopeptide repeat protein [Kribbella catacumbae]